MGVSSQSVQGRRAIAVVIQSCGSWLTRTYSTLRFLILRQPFLDEIGQYLPAEGRVLDLGCGFGLFSLYYATLEPARQLTGVDLSESRIRAARASAERLGRHNVRYECSDVRKWGTEDPYDAIYMLDLIHHLPEREVLTFLESVRNRLRPGGMLVIKEVSNRPRYKMWFTLLLDRLMVGNEPIHYWPPEQLMELLGKLGFDVKRHQMKDFLPYPHVLYLCRLEPQPGSIRAEAAQGRTQPA